MDATKCVARCVWWAAWGWENRTKWSTSSPIQEYHPDVLERVRAQLDNHGDDELDVDAEREQSEAARMPEPGTATGIRGNKGMHPGLSTT